MYKKTIIVMFLLSVYVLKLSMQNELQFYIHPRYIVITILSAVVTLVSALLALVYRNRMHEHGETKHVIGFGYILIVVVLCVAILLPARPLQSFTALQRSAPGAPLGPNVSALINSPVNPDDSSLTIREWIILLNRKNANIVQYEGRTVDLSGFLYPNTDRQFYISRFVITCCTADATPVGIPVQYDWSTQFKDGEWIRVIGKISIVNMETVPQAIVIPTSVQQIPQPAMPYIY